MREELEKLVAAGKISRQHVEPLLQLVQSGYCTHRSWGFGKITTVDTVFSRLTIDFQSKAGHSMDLVFGAETLKPIPSDHILARKASDLNGLRQMAALHHLDLMRLVLQSFGGAATLDQIQQVLVPDVIEEDWKKWWEVVKREMKKDGHFVVPLRKSEPVLYAETQVSIQDRLMAEFRAAKGLKARVTVGYELLKNAEDLADLPAAIREAVDVLNAEIRTHQQTLPALALEGIFLREELRRAGGLPPSEAEVAAAAVWNQQTEYDRVFESISVAKHKQALHSFQVTFPERWDQLLLGFLNRTSTRLAGECARALIDSGKIEPLKVTLARLINQHTASSELLLWLAKARSDAFADILGPEVFRAMLTAMERDQFAEKKSNRLGDYLLDDQDLLVELIGAADLDIVRDLTRALQFSPVFDDMDKRSLLARIVKSYPSVQSLISGEQTRQDMALVVSWPSLERRKHEYEELVHRRIPANAREIAHARGYGDLRENHEYKAAKEMQRLLMRRKAELEQELVRARGTDFSDARADVVGIGTRVAVVEPATQRRDAYSILGAWDSDPDHGVISYLSPIARALLNRKPGDEVEFELDGARHCVQIESVSVAPPPPAVALGEPPSSIPTEPEPESAELISALASPAEPENAGDSPPPEQPPPVP